MWADKDYTFLRNCKNWKQMTSLLWPAARHEWKTKLPEAFPRLHPCVPRGMQLVTICLCCSEPTCENLHGAPGEYTADQLQQTEKYANASKTGEDQELLMPIIIAALMKICANYPFQYHEDCGVSFDSANGWRVARDILVSTEASKDSPFGEVQPCNSVFRCCPDPMWSPWSHICFRESSALPVQYDTHCSYCEVGVLMQNLWRRGCCERYVNAGERVSYHDIWNVDIMQKRLSWQDKYVIVLSFGDPERFLKMILESVSLLSNQQWMSVHMFMEWMGSTFP